MNEEQSLCEWMYGHEWETIICWMCGGYLGQECLNCNYWYDGGDHVAGREDYWCECGYGSPHPPEEEE